MNLHVKHRMTVEEFLAWADARRASLRFDEPKWELFDGVPVMQEHEKWIHARLKYHIAKVIESALKTANLPFEINVDGLGVRISSRESYQPEIAVFPQGLIADDDRFAPDPILVVEVLSPSTRRTDLREKVAGYGQVATIEHYLVVDPKPREILHYRRQGRLLIEPAAPLTSGVLRLDPPGLEIPLSAMFA